MIRTEKQWGYEELYDCTSRIAMKKLFMKAGHRCSLQYHEQKEEMFVIISGTAEFTVGPDQDHLETLILEPGSSFTLPVGMIHRMKAITDLTYIEASTTELNDVVRLQDDYGRSK